MNPARSDGGAEHRHGCTHPGWTVTPAAKPQGWSIARCAGCGTVELRRTSKVERGTTDLFQPPGRPVTSPDVTQERALDAQVPPSGSTRVAGGHR